MTLTQIKRAGLDGDALDRVFTIGASGSSAYTFQGEGLNGTVNNPTLYLTRGKTYRFENGSGGHPIRIQSTSGASGTAYNTGVTNNAGSGTVIIEVQHNAPDVLYYQCTSHAAMNGILYITGALVDGGVTEAKLAGSAVTEGKIANSAVTTVKIANGAVTGIKLANNSVTSAQITANSVVTGAIQDQAVTLDKLPHGTSSNDGKFLRANNGADPTFETITGTTINNNADNRIITGSGTANTLEGESTLTYNGSGTLEITDNGSAYILTGPGATKHEVAASASDNDLVIQNNKGGGNVTSNIIFKGSGAGGGTPSEKLRITDTGVGINHDTSGVSSNAGLTIGNRVSSTATRFNLVNNGSSSVESTQIFSQNNELAFTASGSEKFRIKSGGNCELADGDLVVANGHGISFGATADTAGAISEVLTDYEEGTFTPTIFVEGQSNTSLSLAIGRYVKIGRTVHIHIEVQLNGTPSNRSTSNAWQFGNFPFNPIQYSSSPAGGLRDYRYPMIAMNVDTSSTYGSNGHFVFRLFDYTTSGRIEWQHSDLSLKNASLFMQDGTVVQFAVTYCTG